MQCNTTPSHLHMVGWGGILGTPECVQRCSDSRWQDQAPISEPAAPAEEGREARGCGAGCLRPAVFLCVVFWKSPLRIPFARLIGRGSRLRRVSRLAGRWLCPDRGQLLLASLPNGNNIDELSAEQHQAHRGTTPGLQGG